MEKDAKIYVAGHSGLVGTAIVRMLREQGYKNLLLRTSSELDLRRQADVEAFFERERPRVVILAAARVGGIWANMNNPAPFFYDNMMIQLNVVHAAWRFGAERLLFVSSSCSYPRMCPQPMKEEYILTGVPEPTNETYAIAKISGMKMIEAYHRQYGVRFFSVIFPNLFGCNGILFNHESPRRGETFVTRKITRAATRIKVGLQEKVFMGNMEAKRDWGFAGDYVEAMWLMLQQDEPDDYVVATGETHSVREFTEKVFQKLGLDWRAHVEIDPRYYRPTEVDVLLGDASKARKKLGWTPKVGFEALIDMMVAADLEQAQKEKTLKDAGFTCEPKRILS